MTMKTTLAALRRAHNQALDAAVDALLYGDTPVRTHVLTLAHTASYNRLTRAVQTAPKGVCEWCGCTHDVTELQPLEHDGVAAWFEEHQAYDRDLKQCYRCRETWFYEAGYGHDWPS